MNKNFITAFVKAKKQIRYYAKAYDCKEDGLCVTSCGVTGVLTKEDWDYLEGVYKESLCYAAMPPNRISRLALGQERDTFKVLISLLNVLYESFRRGCSDSYLVTDMDEVRVIIVQNVQYVIWSKSEIHVHGKNAQFYNILKKMCIDRNAVDSMFKLGEKEYAIVYYNLCKETNGAFVFNSLALGTKIAFRVDPNVNCIVAKCQNVEGTFCWKAGENVPSAEDVLIFTLLYRLIDMFGITEIKEDLHVQDIYVESQKYLTRYLKALGFKEVEPATLAEIFRLLKVSNTDVTSLVHTLKELTPPY